MSDTEWPTSWGTAKERLEALLEPGEEVLVTVGLAFRRPTTHDVPCALDEIEERFKPREYWCDVGRLPRDGRVHLDLLTGGDLF